MKRKKRYRLKKIRVILAIIILTTIFTLAFNSNNLIDYVKLKQLNYSNESIKLIKENDLTIEKYSKTLDKIIKTEYFDIDKYTILLDIEYKNNENFLENVNKLIELGYNANEINTIYNKVDNIDLILNNDYKENILEILNNSYFKKDNLERYLKYDGNNTVLDVNMYLDYEFYEHDINIEKVDNLVIVNKYYKLDKDYKPELVSVSSKYSIDEKQLLTKDANIAFEEMCEAAKKDGIYIYSGSSYRSYDYQSLLYNDRVKTDGLEYANQTAAKAGYSEHQTGLAIDITNKKWRNYIEDDFIEYEWLIENSYKYGYILRYPEGKEHITGYAYEPWHFRYITVEVATELKEKNITYEEYIGMK